MNVTANATRVGNWWAIEVPAIPGLFTQTRRLDQIEKYVKDAAKLLDTPVAEVTINYTLPEELRTLSEKTTQIRKTARAAETEASEMSQQTITKLRSEGFTVRDVAAIIGISPQRVSALTK